MLNKWKLLIALVEEIVAEVVVLASCCLIGQKV